LAGGRNKNWGRKLASLAVVAVAVIAVVVVAVAAPGDGSHAVTPRSKASQAPAKPPVILLTFDEFPPDTLQTPDGRIDAARYPNFAKLAATSTWYWNAVTIHDSTNKAVPAILDARKPRRTAPATLKGHPKNVFTLFGGQGYKVVASEEATSMCPHRYCPHSRGGVGRIKELLRAGRKQRFAKWVSSIRPGARFYYKHMYIPHGPRVYLESGHEVPAPSGATAPLSGTVGYNDRGLTDHNHLRYLEQLAFTDHELGTLLARLRHEGMFDKAMIVVLADHGYSFQVGTRDRRLLTPSNIDQIAPIPLFIKTPGQHQGAIDKAYVRTIDVLPTMAASLGFPIDWKHDGRPASDPSVRGRRTITLFKRFFNGDVSIGATELEKRRRANIRRWQRKFSTGARSKRLYGSPYASLYRIGPHNQLIGRKLSGLRTVGQGPVSIRVADTRLRQSVNKASALRPTRIAGVVSGGRPGADRDIAVAVNGRVRAVARSLHVIGGRLELFAVMVPESSLRQGRNDVRVYQVTRQGSGLVLSLLGRA
jgi:hypothetical protein